MSDATRKLTALSLWLVAALAVAGCAKPFMGVPEWRTVRYEDEDPHTPFRGVPKLTAVQKTEYRNYIRAVREGIIVAREERGDTMYFAVARPVSVRIEPSGPGQAGTATVVVTERFKATIPAPLEPLETPLSKRPPTGTVRPKTPTRSDIKKVAPWLPKGVTPKDLEQAPQRQ